MNRPIKVKPRKLVDDDELTQFGEHNEPFRNNLRPEIFETELSLILGRQSARDVGLFVRRHSSPKDRARYTTVGLLRLANFTVRHTPSPGNPLHVSVELPGEGPWDESLETEFDKCFTAVSEEVQDRG